MESLEVSVIVRRNGIVLEEMVRRIEVQESQSFSILKADDGNTTTFTALPADQLDTIQALVLRANKAVTVRLNGQTTAGIPLNAGGMLVILDSTITAGSPIANVSTNNDSGAPALLEGIVGGE